MISLLVNLIGLLIQSGGQTPPPPKLSTQAGDSPEAGQIPIDGEIWVLLILGITLGIYIIYTHHQTINKAS